MAREVATFVRAVRDFGNRLHASPHRPNQTPVSDWKRAVLWHWWRARKPKRRQTERDTWNTGWEGNAKTASNASKNQLPPFVVKQCCSMRCRSLESIHLMRSPVCSRHLYPSPHKPVVMVQVFDSVIRWRTEGHDQMLLLVDDAIIHGFRATCNCLARDETRRSLSASDKSDFHEVNNTPYCYILSGKERRNKCQNIELRDFPSVVAESTERLQCDDL